MAWLEWDYVDGDGHNFWSYFIENVTTQEYYQSDPIMFDGAQQASAEWILEEDGQTGLADFGVDSFGPLYMPLWPNFTSQVSRCADLYNCTDMTSGVINSFGNDVVKVIMTNNGKSSGRKMAVPSALASDGASFKVNWKAAD
jgi:hypothetical protein